MSSSPTVYRPATSLDYLDTVRRLAHDGYGYNLIAQNYLNDVRSQTELKERTLRILTHEGVAVGCIWVSLDTITHMQIHKEHRNKGFDHQLVQHAFLELKSRDRYFLVIEPTLGHGLDVPHADFWAGEGFVRRGQVMECAMRKGLWFQDSTAVEPCTVRVELTWRSSDGQRQQRDFEVGGVKADCSLWPTERIHLLPNLQLYCEASLKVLVDRKLIYEGELMSVDAQYLGARQVGIGVFIDHIVIFPRDDEL